MNRRLTFALWLVLMHPASALAQGVDFLYLAQQYGQNVVDTLHTEIMNDAVRRSIGAGQSPAPARTEEWPAHINESTINGHVFTVEELIAMRHSDPDRMRALIDGREIRVYGQVVRNERADSSFRVAAPDDNGYHVWAYWRSWSGQLPADGSWLELRGVFAMERRSYGVIRDGDFYDVSSTRQGPAPTVTNLGQAAQRPATTVASLTYAPDAGVSQAVIELVAETLAPALTGGASKADLLDALNSGQLQAAWAQLMSEQGFSTTDLADVMTGHLVIAWQVANNVPDLNEVAGGNLVRQGIREALLQADWVAYAEEAEIQAMAEMLMLGTMLITSVYVHAMETGNGSLLASAGEDARQMVLGYGGPDLLDYDFNAEGFVGR